jgi:hypothetical protein
MKDVGKFKPWQIVVVVAAVVAVGISVLRLAVRESSPHLADSVRMVDVNTGDLFDMQVGRTMIPAKNPRTGTYSLLPVERRDGEMVLSERYRVALKGIEGSHGAVEASTGKVRTKP